MGEIKFNTEEVARMLNVQAEAFAKNRKRYEEYMVKDGYVFTKTGRGNKTIYIFTKIPNTWANMNISQKIEEVFGFKSRYPRTMLMYMLWLYRQNKATYYTDREMAEILQLPKAGDVQINRCRNELIKNGYMYPTKNQKLKKFYLISKAVKEEIKKDYACKVFREWRDRTDANIKRYTDRQQEEGLPVAEGVIKAIRRGITHEIQSEIGGILVVVKARQVTREFKEKMEIYIKNEGWNTNQVA